MKNRRAFLIASGAASAVFALARRDEPAALAAPASKAPSAAARAQAATMRRFDRHLTDGDLQTIARGIDDANAAAAPLRSKRDPLRNGDEPVTSFAVPFD